MGWKSLAVAACALAAAGIGVGTGIHAAPQQAQAQAVQDPEECTKLVGLDAQMACLSRAMQAIQDMSANAEPIEELPPDKERIVGDPSSGACHLKGQTQPVWPNGQPMGPTVTGDQCVANHGAAVADFAEFCEAGLQIAQQAGPSNVVLRYLDKCPANPKSMCSMKHLPRAGADPNDESSYTARVDFYFYPANAQQADEAGCEDKRFF